MADYYQLAFDREQILDYDINFIRDVVNRYMDVDYSQFNKAFRDESLVFDADIGVDSAQLCLSELEEAGIAVEVKKLWRPDGSQHFYESKKQCDISTPKHSRNNDEPNGLLTEIAAQEIAAQMRRMSPSASLWKQTNKIVLWLAYLFVLYEFFLFLL